MSSPENNEAANPTVSMLTRYADTVGKKVLIVFADANEGEAERYSL
jgi:hypothetical protein